MQNTSGNVSFNKSSLNLSVRKQATTTTTILNNTASATIHPKLTMTDDKRKKMANKKGLEKMMGSNGGDTRNIK